MKTIKMSISLEQVIKKSIFICNLYKVESVIDCERILHDIKKRYSDATHNCYSYIIGESGNIAKSSDDGEPSGTAGVVIYEVLKKNDLTNVLAIVTRYFGGIMLGAGGLIRAYGSSVSLALKQTELEEIIKYKTLKLSFDYPYYNLVLKVIKEDEITYKSFENNVLLEILVPEDKVAEICTNLINITQNNLKIDHF